jgi:hypothetical protein
VKRIALAAALAGAVALAGCQTIDTIDSYIKKNLPIACSSMDVAHQAFLVAHAARPFSQATLDSEATAYANAKTFCDNPGAVNTVAIVTTILTTAIQINAYIRQAERAGVE